MKIDKLIIPILLTILTVTQFFALIKGVVAVNWYGVIGYLNAIVGFIVITVYCWLRLSK